MTAPPLDVPRPGDPNPDLVLTGDVVPRSGRPSSSSTAPTCYSAGPGRSPRMAWPGSVRGRAGRPGRARRLGDLVLDILRAAGVDVTP